MLRTCNKRLYSTAGPLLKTPLHSAHLELGGKMVPYAGFEMPVLYKSETHIESHNWVRSKAGLFDVSHMLQHTFLGPEAQKLLEKITPIDLDGLGEFQSSLSVLLNKQGGVIDDCIITKHGKDQFYMVTNAGCREKDLSFIKSELSAFDLQHKTFEGTLLAIQGPKAQEILQKYTTEDLSKIFFGHSKYIKLSTNSAPVHLARSGYTGEDGFELSIPSSNAKESQESIDFFMSMLNEYPDIVKPIGLAARDSLRLEAGMCLYGHELTEEITPVQASLTWLIPKSRREQNTGFNGSSTILSQIKDKSLLTSRRIGVVSKGPSPRDNNKIFNEDGSAEVGYITSGSPSPTNGGNVAQAYIDKKVKIGTNVKIEIRGKLRDATVAKLPFVAPNFYKE